MKSNLSPNHVYGA